MRRLRELSLGGREPGRGQEVETVDDRVERRADLVGNGRDEFRLGGNRRFRRLVGEAPCRLGLPPRRDVGIERDEATVGHQAAAQLDRRAVRPEPLSHPEMREVAHMFHAQRHLPLDIVRAELAQAGLDAEDLLDRHADAQHLARHAGALEEEIVPLPDPELAVEQRDAVRHIGEHALELHGPRLGLGLGGGEPGVRIPELGLFVREGSGAAAHDGEGRERHPGQQGEGDPGHAPEPRQRIGRPGRRLVCRCILTRHPRRNRGSGVLRPRY
jgi:hypothetical protein